MKNAIITLLFCFGFLSSCSVENDVTESITQIPAAPQPENPPTEDATTYKYLALGDSYTIGQNVCETCRFPAQLKEALETSNPQVEIDLSVVATTGWTTTNLLNAVNTQNPANDKDLVTLLIGVNNQYQHKPFSLYESEFPQLVMKAITLAKGEKNNVIVISIPDYAYTPSGQSSQYPAGITLEINQYNAFAKNYCEHNNIEFIDITDITRLGLENPALVASDGLHPSTEAYRRFVERILPIAMNKILY